MLGLTRRVGEQVLIGDDVIMEIEWIRGGSVRLVFDAPVSVSIDRPEYVVKKLTEQMDMIGDGV
jgi:carbon storage regulator|tara:strand:- start:298 stop:489 length:192 start_codon:yes stop_codon:yes gene_type:complete